MHKKTGLIICLTSAILLIIMLLSTTSFAQLNKGNIKKQIPLDRLLKNICDQNGYDFIFNGKVFKGTRSNDIDYTKMKLDEALRSVLNGFPLTYTLQDNLVVLKVTEDKNPAVQTLPSAERLANNRIKSITGLITDEKKNGLPNAVVRIKNTTRGAVTKEGGFFVINDIPAKTTFLITYTGYKPEEVVFENKPIMVQMKVAIKKLEQVNIIQTGYQSLPKERATGSFSLVDSALLERKVSTNILERLNGVTSALSFDKNANSSTPDIIIRAKSTIFGNAMPLIVLDNFTYDGDISNINPQDVKSITILKDGAAASIWGSGAGNGVIVITTKQGMLNQKPRISLNSNLTVGGKPDPYFKEQLSNKEYIDIEQFLFDKGKYNPKINTGYASLSPAVEVMLLRRQNAITDLQKTAMLDSIAAHDNREDLDKYFYRKSVSRQYQLSVNGGGKDNKYHISLGYDKNLANNVINNFERVTLNVNNTTYLLNQKVQLMTGLLFSSINNKIKGAAYLPLYPYEKLASHNGLPLAVTDGTLRLPYVDTAGKGKLLDWHYRPLEELKSENHSFDSNLSSYKINLGINYSVICNLNFSINYTYDKGVDEYAENYGSGSYYTRNLINSFTQIDPASGAVTRPIPLGDILTNGKNSYYAHYGRGQLSYANDFAKKHAVSAIAGYEVKDYQNSQAYVNLYGYDKTTATNMNYSINQAQNFPYYYNSNISKIPLAMVNSGMIDRYLSYFANASYTFNQKYIFSASARRDQSNLFGVKANQKGVPLWSAGLSWNLSKEDFYQFSGLPFVKIRATFGYNGNVDKTTSAYLTTQTVNGGNEWGQPILLVNNPPNPSLRWEKVKNINFGIDFGTSENRISGSLEYWRKDGIDLIGLSPIAPQTGISIFKGNSANTQAKGIDLLLNTVNVNVFGFKWLSTFLFNYNTDKITNYKVKPGNNADMVTANYITPMEGFPLSAIFSYKWEGLDSNGNPQSLLNGHISGDYISITSSKNATELVYSGTLRPKYYGSVRNTLSYRSWEVSFNLVYKFNYYFRRSSLNNFNLYQGSGYSASYQQADYNRRWQKPGDELITDVPGLIYPARSARDDIYKYADILVEKADHIRLQDVQLNYEFNKEKLKNLPFSTINLYLYTANLGIMWKASHKKIDPDYPNGSPLPTTTSLGIKANF